MAYTTETYYTSNSTASTAWTQWTDPGTSSYYTTQPWFTWTTTSATTTTVTATSSAYASWVEHITYRQETREAQQDRLARETEAQRVATEQRLQREAVEQRAAQRAEQLLVETLTTEQARAWQENRAFFVTGHKTGKRYKIREGSHGNIKELDAQGKECASLCVNVPRGLPNQDNVLAQKLMLEWHEEELLRRANRHTF